MQRMIRFPTTPSCRKIALRFHFEWRLLSHHTQSKSSFIGSILQTRYHSGVTHEKRQSKTFNLPNIISLSRIVASPGLSVAIYYDMKEVAFAGCLLAAFTDWLDGYIAKTYNQKTVLGAFLDPLGDKFVIGALTCGLAAKGLLPVPLACLIIGRDVFLVTCTIVIRMLEKPEGAAFFDTAHSATYEITPTDISKVNTAVQFLLLSSTLGHFSIGAPDMTIIEPLHWVAAITTLASGIGYLDGAGVTKIPIHPPVPVPVPVPVPIPVSQSAPKIGDN